VLLVPLEFAPALTPPEVVEPALSGPRAPSFKRVVALLSGIHPIEKESINIEGPPAPDKVNTLLGMCHNASCHEDLGNRPFSVRRTPHLGLDGRRQTASTPLGLADSAAGLKKLTAGMASPRTMRRIHKGLRQPQCLTLQKWI